MSIQHLQCLIPLAAKRLRHLRAIDPASIPIAALKQFSTIAKPVKGPENMLPAKRSADREPSISPPPTKRVKAKVPSNLTKAAVANFFTPASQKPKIASKVNWSERNAKGATLPTLLVGRYEKTDGTDDPSVMRRKVAAFDLDGTLIKTASGKTFGGDAGDWKWWNPRVPEVVRKYYEDGYRVVIVSNQAAITLRPDPKSKAPKAPKRLPAWKQKLEAIITQLDIPLSVYGATAKDIFRKPRLGMWREMLEDYDLVEADVDKENSFFVGDAAGREALPVSKTVPIALPKDFSCSDRNFAHNAEINFMTPEECFLETPSPARKFTRDLDLSQYRHALTDKPSWVDELERDEKQTRIVLLCGPPGAGKSTLFFQYLKDTNHGSGYFRINQDTLKTRDKCLKVAREHILAQKSVCVDNTNADQETRSHWIALAKETQVPIHCVWVNTNLRVAEHNNALRALADSESYNPEGRDLVPQIAFSSFQKRFQEPNKDEGFFAVYEHAFCYRGREADFSTWAKYWV